MKKMIALMLTLAAVFSFTACGASSPEPTPAPTVVPAEDTSGAWYELSQDGYVLTVRLPSNPSTGYDWSFEFSDDGVIELLTQEFVQDYAPDGIVGVGGTWAASFVCSGSKFGDVTLTLKYSRSWENVDPLDMRTLDLFVNESGEITVLSADSVPGK